MKYNEPWQVEDDGGTTCVVDSKGKSVAILNRYPFTEDRGMAERIVACVNFCQGMSNEALAKIEEISLMCTNEERLKQIIDMIDDFDKV